MKTDHFELGQEIRDAAVGVCAGVKEGDDALSAVDEVAERGPLSSQMRFDTHMSN